MVNAQWRGCGLFIYKESVMAIKKKCTVFTSGLRGAEAAFGEEAVKRGMQECVYTVDGQKVDRKNAQCVNVPCS